MQNKSLGFGLRVISEIAEQNTAVSLDSRIFSQAETGPWQVMVPQETAGRACVPHAHHGPLTLMLVSMSCQNLQPSGKPCSMDEHGALGHPTQPATFPRVTHSLDTGLPSSHVCPLGAPTPSPVPTGT